MNYAKLLRIYATIFATDKTIYMKAEPKEIRHLRNKLSISRDNYLDNIDYQINENNEVTHLDLYEHEYYDFPNLNGDLSFLSEFQHLTSLEVNIRQELDYSVLDQLPLLESLTITADFQPLEFHNFSNLNLKKLYIDENLPAGNLNFVLGMKNLEVLTLYGSEITSLEPLQNLKKLTQISLTGSSINDISPIKELSELTILNLSGNISNVEIVSNFKKLTYLSLTGCEIKNCEFLSELSELTHLDLSYNQINSLEPLGKLGKLTNLTLSHNQISDISPLMSLIDLMYLSLSHNQISQIDPLLKLRNLNSIVMNNNEIEDISILSTLTNLKYLYVSQNQIKEITSVPKFCYTITADDNPIEKIAIEDTVELKNLSVKNHRIKRLQNVIVPTNMNELNLANDSADFINNFYHTHSWKYLPHGSENANSLSFEDMYKEIGTSYFSKDDYKNAHVYFRRINKDLQFVRDKNFEQSLIEYSKLEIVEDKLTKLWDMILTFNANKARQPKETVKFQSDKLFSLIANEPFKHSDKETLMLKLSPPAFVKMQNNEYEGNAFDQILMFLLVLLIAGLIFSLLYVIFMVIGKFML